MKRSRAAGLAAVLILLLCSALVPSASAGAVPQLCDLKLNPDGAPISCSGVVMAVFGDVFYMQAVNRACGIRVHLASHGVFVSQAVAVSGTLATSADGERTIEADSAVVTGSGTTGAIAMRINALGGEKWHHDALSGAGQAGVVNGAGLNNIGMLVKTIGRVTWVAPGQQAFTIWDGSRWRSAEPVDSAGNPGVRVVAPAVISPGLAVGDYVRVTGISGCYAQGGSLYALLRARTLSDIEFQGSGPYEPLLNPSNGHYYEIVPAALGWDASRVAAEGRKWKDVNGHLAVLSSAQEFQWVQQNLTALNSLNRTNFWLGGYQDKTAPDFSEPGGGWRWVTIEPWSYTAWAPSEPNNILYGNLPGRPTEDFLEWNLVQGGWNDLIESAGVPVYRTAQGYMVEYEPAP